MAVTFSPFPPSGKRSKDVTENISVNCSKSRDRRILSRNGRNIRDMGRSGRNKRPQSGLGW